MKRANRKLEQLLSEYRATADTLRLRRDMARHAVQNGAFDLRGEADRRAQLLGDMYLDVQFTIREIENYLDG